MDVVCHEHPCMYRNTIFGSAFVQAVGIGRHIVIACEAHLPIVSTLDYVSWMVGWAESRKTWHLRIVGLSRVG